MLNIYTTNEIAEYFGVTGRVICAVAKFFHLGKKQNILYFTKEEFELLKSMRKEVKT